MEDRIEAGELIQGTLDMLILKALVRGPMHGYAVAEWIQQTSQQVLKVEEGALYPALHRLELRGVLKAEWGLSDNNRRAKYYELTRSGTKQLEAETDAWHKLAAAGIFDKGFSQRRFGAQAAEHFAATAMDEAGN